MRAPRRARDLSGGIYRFVWFCRFFKNYIQLTKGAPEVLIRVLLQEYEGLTKLPSRRVISSAEEHF